ncbi:hypothetical protein X777_08055 [Ooceraea biroi]|uniref:Uncharacterized protein n=1 Tax=Ooceraea biroi TaxID=2015173 RepID=A0A026W900_OOCBI|nr:hypothetical protein X777_08055 [Ooceraea biroi]
MDIECVLSPIECSRTIDSDDCFSSTWPGFYIGKCTGCFSNCTIGLAQRAARAHSNVSQCKYAPRQRRSV